MGGGTTSHHVAVPNTSPGSSPGSMVRQHPAVRAASPHVAGAAPGQAAEEAGALTLPSGQPVTQGLVLLQQVCSKEVVASPTTTWFQQTAFRPISMRRISLVPAPISYSLASREAPNRVFVDVAVAAEDLDALARHPRGLSGTHGSPKR